MSGLNGLILTNKECILLVSPKQAFMPIELV